MYLTLIHHEFAGDTYFPEFEEDDWLLAERQDFATDADNQYPYSFLTYLRKKENQLYRGSRKTTS
jgi:dihydrofolate reductase